MVSEKRKKVVRSWRKLLSEDETVQERVQQNCDTLLPLLQQNPGCNKLNDDVIQEWMEKDEQQELTDCEMIAVVNRDDNENVEDIDAGTGLELDKTERMSQ
jgi:hypothetical protein